MMLGGNLAGWSWWLATRTRLPNEAESANTWPRAHITPSFMPSPRAILRTAMCG